MGKETVRYPDALVARIEEVVADSDAFESKSEFHRFASDFLLTLLDPDHDPSVLGYGDILADLEAELESRIDPADVRDDGAPFLDAYVQVRHHLLHGEVEDARAYVADAYDVTDREALLLDELVWRYSREAPAPPSTPTTPSRDSRREPEQSQRVDARPNGGLDLDGPDPDDPDGPDGPDDSDEVSSRLVESPADSADANRGDASRGDADGGDDGDDANPGDEADHDKSDADTDLRVESIERSPETSQ